MAYGCHNNRHIGFTLIELSIVLIVIGLLIGGVLVARSMIESAKIHAIISRSNQYKVMYQQFKDKFNQLPADSNLGFSPGTGNNDGVIHNYGEAQFLAAHLAEAGFYQTNEDFSSGCDGSDLAATAAAEKKCYLKGVGSNDIFMIRQSGFSAPGYIGFSYGPDTYYSTGPGGASWRQNNHWLAYGNFYPTASVYRLGPVNSMSPALAMSIDSKIDDGLPRTGNVLGFYRSDTPSSSVDCYDAAYPWTGTASSPYSISISSDHCTLYFYIGNGMEDVHL